MSRYFGNVIVSVFVLLLCGCSESFKFPTDIERCPVGDNDCMIESANKVLGSFSTDGHKGINLIPVDPLYIPRIYIQQGEESPVAVELIFLKSNVYGLGGCRLYKLTGFQKDPNGKYEIRMKGAAIQLVGDYNIKGKILILPIQGVGKSNITMVDPDVLIKFTGKSVTKNDKVYLQPQNLRLSFTMNQLIFNLTNLFNGDKVLGDNMNLFLNENWRDVFPEIRESVFDAFGQIFENVLKNVFSKVPYNDLFKDEQSKE